jgi:hypothetical protein
VLSCLAGDSGGGRGRSCRLRVSCGITDVLCLSPELMPPPGELPRVIRAPGVPVILAASPTAALGTPLFTQTLPDGKRNKRDKPLTMLGAGGPAIMCRALRKEAAAALAWAIKPRPPGSG